MHPMYRAKDDWNGDGHRHNQQAHYRLYLGRDGAPTVISVQDFDYLDYDARRMLSSDAWNNESDAEHALAKLIPTIVAASNALPATLLADDLRAIMLAAAAREAQLGTEFATWSNESAALAEDAFEAQAETVLREAA